jgi:AcrR family transcriptional regulator
MDRRDSIVDAACATAISLGIADLTVADVARRAGVSSGLVHYHFRTKQQLLAAAGERLAARRSAARERALESGDGLGALDALWAVLQVGAESEAERAWDDLALLARRDPVVRRTLAAQRRIEQQALAARLPGLLTSLGAEPPVPREEAASLVLHFLDGAALALAAGCPPDDVRAAYDAFWLVLVTAGQARAHR